MITTIGTILATHAAQNSAGPAIHRKVGNVWETINWSRYSNDAQSFAKSLIALGVSRGEAIGVLSGNRYEWFLTLAGCSIAGAMPAGIYSTNSPEEIAYVLNDSAAPVVIVENQQHMLGS